MPAAIEKHCWVAGGPRADRKLVIHSEDFSETIEADLAQSVALQNHQYRISYDRPGKPNEKGAAISATLKREGTVHLSLHGNQ